MPERSRTRNTLAYTAALCSFLIVVRGLWLAHSTADVERLAGAMSYIIGLLLTAYVGRVLSERVLNGKGGSGNGSVQ